MCITSYNWLCYVGLGKTSFIIACGVEMKFNLCYNVLKSLRILVIINHNCICIKSIVIFSFMKLVIKLLIVITCFLVYCHFVYNFVIPWPFHKYFSTMQFPPILTVFKINFFFDPYTFWILIAPRIMKCIFLFYFIFKPSHEATFENYVHQTHV
jgi:hypothetical protein